MKHHPFDGEINHFVDCVLHDKTSFVDLADAAKARRRLDRLTGAGKGGVAQ